MMENMITKCEFKKEMKRLQGLYEDRAREGTICAHQDLGKVYQLRQAYTIIVDDLQAEEDLILKLLETTGIKCSMCGNLEGFKCVDPYIEDIEGNRVEVILCHKCHNARCDEI